MVWGAGPVSCDLQVAGSIPVATWSRDPPYHRGFGDCVIAYMYDCDLYELYKYAGQWAEIGEETDPP